MPNVREISLFVPCLVDQVYPEIGLAMATLLERLGYSIYYDPDQTCCGQPGFNAGDRAEAATVARHFVRVFRQRGAIVCPSGSCTAMVRNFYPTLLAGDPLADDARGLGSRVFELGEFLVRRGDVESISGSARGRVAFHNSCHSYRELRIADEPIALLGRIDGIELVDIEAEPVCCGFGGVFSVKFESIAAAMARTRLEKFVDLEVDTLVSNDPGCILHMRQEAAAKKYEIEILHLAEFLERALEASE